MDLDIGRWVLDYLARNLTDDRTFKQILSALPLPDNENLHWKKTMLLRAIYSEVSNGSVSEKTLDTLEMIAEVDRRDGHVVLETMKSAYFAVAVDCTVRFMEEDGNNTGKYFDSVKRIWRRRILNLETYGCVDLISDQLRKWRDKLESAILDDIICKEILAMNTRNAALKAVRVYVTEAWKVMGPTFLELAAKEMGKSLVVVPDETRIGERDEGGSGRPAAINENQEEHIATPQLGKDVGVNDEPTSIDQDQEIGVSLDKARGKSIVDANVIVIDQNQAEERAGLTDSAPTLRGKEPEEGNVYPKRRQSSGRGTHSRKGIKITNVDESTIGTSGNKLDCLPSPEVNKVQDALRSSSLELQAVVKDPLPEALRFINNVICDVGRKNSNHGPSVDNGPSNSVDERGEIGQKHDGPSPNFIEETMEKMKASAMLLNKTKSNGAVQGSKGSSRDQNNEPRPNLMARNSTARTYEWDDSIDTSSEEPGRSKRIRLESLKKKAVSPLKLYAPAPKLATRRKNKRWSNVEEDTLRNGVKEFGVGNWKLILTTYKHIFEERNEVDLKDKWRNLMK